MPILFAALMLVGGQVPSDGDDDPAERRRPKTTIRHRVHDDDDAKPKAPAHGKVQPNDDDDAKVRAGARSTTAAQPDDDDDKPKAPASDAQTDVANGAPNAQEHGGDEDDAENRVPSTAIVVTARRLDAARTQIDAALGSSVYSLTNETVENRPGGETGKIADILAQAPGVTLSGRTLSVRGSPANQVRINNVIIPEAISDPADHLSSRLAETTRLITGTLPAQFGFAPGGVIGVTTKNGLYQHGGQAELFAGSDGMIEPALEWAGSAGGTSLFGSGSFEHDRSTVADPAGVTARDRRDEVEGLGFADHVIDENNRASLIVGGDRERNRYGPTTISAGTTISNDGYAVGTFQHSQGRLTVQTSLFGGFGSTSARFGERTRERRSTYGTQIDASDELGTGHTLRFGLLANRSSARELEDSGTSSAHRTTLGVYAQDEWKITSTITFNPGARIDWLRGLGSSAKVEPRASFVWSAKSGLTGHVGYARYVAAPALGEQVVGAGLRDERDDYVDAGVQQQLGHLTVGIDLYRRWSRNFIAEHETIGSALPTAFEFSRARLSGLELSATYAHGALTAWANLSLSRARARTIIGGEGLFSSDLVAASATRSLPLASERPVLASGGLTWRLGKLTLSGDALASSGAVRTLSPHQPNGSRYAAFAEVGLAAVYHARIASQPADIRLDLTNLTNVRYAAGDASSLTGGWTRIARGRAITIGIEQGF